MGSRIDDGPFVEGIRLGLLGYGIVWQALPT